MRFVKSAAISGNGTTLNWCDAAPIPISGSCTTFGALGEISIDICAVSCTDVCQIAPEVRLLCQVEILRTQLNLHDF